MLRRSSLLPEWSAEVWGIIVSACIGIAGMVVAVIALRKSSIANKHADEANNIANEANKIAKQALQVQERGVEHQVETDLRSRRANLWFDPYTPKSAKREIATFTLKNRGPGVAHLILVEFGEGEKSRAFDHPGSVKPDGDMKFDVQVGRLVDLDEKEGYLDFTLQVRFSDGSGEGTLQKIVNVSPGEQFVEREITVDDGPKGNLIA